MRWSTLSSDEVQLNRGPQRQRHHADRSHSRVWRVKMSLADVVHRCKILHIGKINPDAHDIGERFTCCREYRAKIRDDLFGLRPDPSGDQSCGGGSLCNLSADKDEIPGENSRRKRTYRLSNCTGCDGFSGHSVLRASTRMVCLRALMCDRLPTRVDV